MRIDVWVDDEKVGTMEVPTRSKEVPSEFPIIKYGLSQDMAETQDFHWIQVSRKHVEFDQLALEQGACDLGKYDIPEGAEMCRMMEQMKIRFSWFVATPTLDQYEIMFDHPGFHVA